MPPPNRVVVDGEQFVMWSGRVSILTVKGAGDGVEMTYTPDFAEPVTIEFGREQAEAFLKRFESALREAPAEVSA
jgi:hypothetical protein